MTREEAKAEFAQLLAQYGLQWKANVPPSARAQLQKIDRVLTDEDRREVVRKQLEGESK